MPSDSRRSEDNFIPTPAFNEAASRLFGYVIVRKIFFFMSYGIRFDFIFPFSFFPPLLEEEVILKSNFLFFGMVKNGVKCIFR